MYRIFLNLFLLFFLVKPLFAYEWYQLSNQMLIHKSLELPINKKLEEINFNEIIFHSTKESLTLQKKFLKLNNIQKIVLIGDTGCRLKEGILSSEYQDCNNKQAWPFESILQHIQKENADLLIHLGDYHYREQCSSKENCKDLTMGIGYSWYAWQLDFFDPIKLINTEVPMILVRGNHEDCQRAFLGYKLFLSDINWEQNCVDYEADQLTTFGGVNILNIDTSSINDKPILSKSEEKIWVLRFDNIYKKLEKNKIKKVWIVTHKPAYGLAPFFTNYIPTNINFRNYLEKSKLIRKVQFIFSGHVHTSLVIETHHFPTQIVLGNGGTKLDELTSTLPVKLLKLYRYNTVNFISNGFGYAVMTKINNDWKIDFKDSESKTIFTKQLN